MYNVPVKVRLERGVFYSPCGCWFWMGATTGRDNRYGTIMVNGKQTTTHRVSYEIYKGSIGDLFVCHSCDQTLCVNPDHLFLGTAQDNTDDMIKKDRNRKGENHQNGIFTEVEVKIIREAASNGFKQVDIAKYFKRNRQGVGDIISRRNWSHVI